MGHVLKNALHAPMNSCEFQQFNLAFCWLMLCILFSLLPIFITWVGRADGNINQILFPFSWNSMLYHIKQAAIINWRENYIQFQCVLQLAALGSQHYKAHTRMEVGGGGVGYSTKVQLLTLFIIYHLWQIVTPFVCLLLTNCTPFTYQFRTIHSFLLL